MPRHEEWVLSIAEALNFTVQTAFSTYSAPTGLGALSLGSAHNRYNNTSPMDTVGYSPLLAKILLLLVFGYAGGSMGPSVDVMYLELAKVRHEAPSKGRGGHMPYY
jgi:hypothetical protein